MPKLESRRIEEADGASLLPQYAFKRKNDQHRGGSGVELARRTILTQLLPYSCLLGAYRLSKEALKLGELEEGVNQGLLADIARKSESLVN